MMDNFSDIRIVLNFFPGPELLKQIYRVTSS